MNLPSQLYIPVLVQILIRAGRELIRTVSLYIMVRLILSEVMQIRCLPEKRQWSLTNLAEMTCHKVLPVINPNGSDSARLDNTLEFLVMSGMELPLAVMITIPEPWENDTIISQKKKRFLSVLCNNDGAVGRTCINPFLVMVILWVQFLTVTDFRPSRYYITDDDYLILSSEVGVLDIDPTKIVTERQTSDRVQMLLVDTVKGSVIDDDELKEEYASTPAIW